MNAKKFSISGYWKDDKTEFSGLTVVDSFDVSKADDEDIFYYGLSEKLIKEAIELVEKTTHDFVITSYEPLEIKNQKKSFVLFETDQWKSTNSRVFLGVFSSRKKAVSSFKENDHFSSKTECVVLESLIDEYGEQ